MVTLTVYAHVTPGHQREADTFARLVREHAEHDKCQWSVTVPAMANYEPQNRGFNVSEGEPNQLHIHWPVRAELSFH